MSVNIGGTEMLVQVPMGVNPGDSFSFLTPAPQNTTADEAMLPAAPLPPPTPSPPPTWDPAETIEVELTPCSESLGFNISKEAEARIDFIGSVRGAGTQYHLGTTSRLASLVRSPPSSPRPLLRCPGFERSWQRQTASPIVTAA